MKPSTKDELEGKLHETSTRTAVQRMLHISGSGARESELQADRQHD